MAKEKKVVDDSVKKEKLSYDLDKIDVAILNIKKELGDGIAIDIDTIPKIARVKCKSPTVGWINGDGGTPLGRIIEIYGQESAGKSLLSQNIAADFQAAGKFVAYVDAEYSFDPQYAHIQGLDTSKEKFKLLQPNCGEDAFTIVEKLAESGQVGLVIVDSLAALVPKSELEGEMTDQQMGAAARMIGKGLRKITAIIAKNNCTVILISQYRMKIGTSYGDPRVTSGGNAPKYYASIRLEVAKTETADGENEGDDALGIKSRIINKKNKTSVPFRKGEVFFSFKTGIDVYGEYLDFAVSMGFVTKGGAWYTIEDSRFQGRAKAIIGLKEDNLLYSKIKDKVDAALEGNPMAKINLPLSELSEEEAPASIKSLAELATN